MNLGISIVLITLLGCASNWLNGRYLNYPATNFLYYIGTLVHEVSHAALCFFTGAKIKEISVFSKNPHVVFLKPKLPIIGKLLISLAPIFGGMLFLFLINKYFLANYFAIPQFSNWQDALVSPVKILSQMNLLDWRSWLATLLCLNVGAMIGPSWQDLKNIWPALIILFFLKWPFLVNFNLQIVILILANILIQIILIAVIKMIRTTVFYFLKSGDRIKS
jgi:hypothetical protein